jgi:hypothetical protein
MLETDPSFPPVRVCEGDPPLEDVGPIGDGATVALVGLRVLPAGHPRMVATAAATGDHAGTAAAPA